MSGFSRNVSVDKRNIPSGYLPEIVSARPNHHSQNSANNGKPRRNNSSSFNERYVQNSTVSSATSRKFQDLFCKSGWPSLSDTGTDSPGYIEIGSSGSSASSMFSWADPDATSLVAEEWEKIQRTLYNEPGPKVYQKHLIDECNQWKSTFPHLRIVGKHCIAKSVEPEECHDTEEEILATQYDSDAEDKYRNRLIRSNNNNLVHKKMNKQNHRQTSGSGMLYKNRQNAIDLAEDLDQCLRITSMNSSALHTIESPRLGGPSSILRSEMSSSRWRNKNSSPDFISLPHQQSKYYHNSRNIHNDRDHSATSMCSFGNKPSSIRNYVNASQNYNVFINVNDENNKSARSIDTTNHKYITVQKPIAVSQMYPMRSISIPHDFSTPKHVGLKGRNVLLPPLQSVEIKVKHHENMSSRSKSNTKKKDINKNLFPINSTVDSITYPEKNKKKHLYGNLSDVKKSGAKTKRNRQTNHKIPYETKD